MPDGGTLVSLQPQSATEALLALATLHFDLQAAGIYPSDRRIGYCVRVMKATAWLAGRPCATTKDMVLLANVLWTKPDQITTVRRLIYALSSPLDLGALDLSSRLDKLTANYTLVAGVDDPDARKR